MEQLGQLHISGLAVYQGQCMHARHICWLIGTPVAASSLATKDVQADTPEALLRIIAQVSLLSELYGAAADMTLYQSSSEGALSSCMLIISADALWMHSHAASDTKAEPMSECLMCQHAGCWYHQLPGWIHGDISPGNIALGDQAFLIDFQTARKLEVGSVRLLSFKAC